MQNNLSLSYWLIVYQFFQSTQTKIGVIKTYLFSLDPETNSDTYYWCFSKHPKSEQSCHISYDFYIYEVRMSRYPKNNDITSSHDF